MGKTFNPPISTREMKTVVRKPGWDRWWLVVIYAVAMAWVESAVAFCSHQQTKQKKENHHASLAELF
jgi:hypothetical protein